MTDNYTIDDALHQAIKALLVRMGDDAKRDIGPFLEINIKVSSDELRRTDDYALTVEVRNALDDNARLVLLRLIRGDQLGLSEES